MKIWVKLLVSSLLIFCATGNARLHAESLVYDLSGITPVWDVSETYVEDVDGISVSFTLAQDSSGRISGGGSWSGSEDGVSLSADMTVKGSIKQSRGITVVSFAVQHKGVATDGIHSAKFSVSQQVNAEIDADLLQMTGTMRTSMSMAGQKFSDVEYWEEDLPFGMDGSCMLELNTVEGANGISGSAVLNLANLESANFDLKGSTKGGVTKITLKGSKVTGDSGASISMEIDAVSRMIRTLKGKVFGQTISGSAVPEGDGDTPSTRI